MAELTKETAAAGQQQTWDASQCEEALARLERLQEQVRDSKHSVLIQNIC